MCGRRLRALGYLEWDKVNANNENHFRKIVVWLEDKKIRQYPMEDRAALRNITNPKWNDVFDKYCKDAGCDVANNRMGRLEWLLESAIWLELGENYKKYFDVAAKKITIKKKSIVPSIKSTNPLDNLDFSSNEFRDGINSVAKLLCVPRHPDHLLTLAACSKVVQLRLKSDKKPVVHEGKPYPVKNIGCGFGLGDAVLEDAVKGLSLMYIQDLRDLQTRINENIVKVQSVTANPKTDTRLGKVGK